MTPLIHLVALNGTFTINIKKLITVHVSLDKITFFFEYTKIAISFEDEEKANYEYMKFINEWHSYENGDRVNLKLVDLNAEKK